MCLENEVDDEAVSWFKIRKEYKASTYAISKTKVLGKFVQKKTDSNSEMLRTEMTKRFGQQRNEIEVMSSN
jgi:hypothetical protein